MPDGGDMSDVMAPPFAGRNRPLSASVDLPRLAFIHIPKTAGTSVTHALQGAYGGQTFPAMTTLDYRAQDDATLLRYRLFKGHAYRSDYQRLPTGTIRFTVLRDPVYRAISYFNYYRAVDETRITDAFIREASHLAKTASPIEFMYSDSPFVIEHLRLGQLRQFLPADTLEAIAHRQFLTRALRQRAACEFIAEMRSFHFVMTCECLALSFPLMAAQLGLPQSCRALTHDNVSAAGDGMDPADVRRAMIDVNAAEFECYDYVRQRELNWLESSLAASLDQTRNDIAMTITS